MINLLLGQPGGGKSYEAVAFHVIPAIEQGRKVITNLSLNLEVFAKFFPGSQKLIDIRNPKLGEKSVERPFSLVEHYGDTWRHPESNAGPLYVIDECHLSLPRVGTQREVEEWYSLHRHEGSDVLLITQSYGKINQAVRDLVQVVYRCKKATAFGTNDKYIRKVQDGLRGEVVNTGIRDYEAKYFQFYKSHTRTNSAVQELAAGDIVPYWKRWPFKGCAIMMIAAASLAVYNLNRDSKPLVKTQPVSVTQPVQQSQPTTTPIATQTPPQPTHEVRGPSKKLHPYDGFAFHLAGLIYAQRLDADGRPYDYLDGYVSITGTGANGKLISLADLRQAGYDITYMSPSVISVGFKGYDVGYVVADSPKVSLTPVDGITKAGN